jgi:hypothetical protein
MILSIPITAIPINTRKIIRVRLRQCHEVYSIDLRTYDAKGFPTKYGFELPVEQLVALKQAVDEAIRRAGALGLPTTHTGSSEDPDEALQFSAIGDGP